MAEFSFFSTEQRQLIVRQCRQSRLRVLHAARQILDTFHTAFPTQRPGLTPDRVRRALGDLAAACLSYADARRVPAPTAPTATAAPKRASVSPLPPRPPAPKMAASVGGGGNGHGDDDAPPLVAYATALNALIFDVLGLTAALTLEGADQVGWFLEDMLDTHMDRVVRRWGDMTLYHERTLFLLSHPTYNFANVGRDGDAREAAYYARVAADPVPLHPEHVRESLAHTNRALRAARGEVAMVTPPPQGGAHELLEHLLYARHLPPAMVLTPDDVGLTAAEARGYPVTLAQVASSVGLYRGVYDEFAPLPWVVHRPLATASAPVMAWLQSLDGAATTTTVYELRQRIDVALAESLGHGRANPNTLAPLVVLPAEAAQPPDVTPTPDPVGAAIQPMGRLARRWFQSQPSADYVAPLRRHLARLFEGRDTARRLERYTQVDLVDALYTDGPDLLAAKKTAAAARLAQLGATAAAIAEDAELSQQTVTEVVSLLMLVDSITTTLRLVGGSGAAAALGVPSHYDETLEDSIELLRTLATDWHLTSQELLPPPILAAVRQIQEILEAGGYGPIEANLDYGGSLFNPPIVTRDIVELEGVRLAARSDLHRLVLEHYMADWMARNDAGSARYAFSNDAASPPSLFADHMAYSCVHVMGHTTVGAALMAAVPWALGLPQRESTAARSVIHIALQRGYSGATVRTLLDMAVAWAPPSRAGRSALPGNMGALVTTMHTLAANPAFEVTAPTADGRLEKLVTLLRGLVATYRITLDELDVERTAGDLENTAAARVQREIAKLDEADMANPDAPRGQLVDGHLTVDAAGTERLPTLLLDLAQLVPPDLLHNAIPLKHALRRALFFAPDSPTL